MMNKILKIFFLFVLLEMPISDAAVMTPSASQILLPSTISVSNNIADGSVIWTSTKVRSTLSITNTPPSSDEIWTSVLKGELAPGFNDVYKTNIAGIGVRWWVTWVSPRYPSGITSSLATGNNSQGGSGFISGSKNEVQTVWVEIVKTGVIQSSGTLLVNTTVALRLGCDGGCVTWNISVGNASTVSTGVICIVSTPRIPVSMGRINFKGMGVGTVSNSSSFTITLVCAGGDSGASLSPYISLTDASNPFGMSNILSLSSESTATGIGIQILKDDVVLGYGPDIGSGSFNKWKWKAGVITSGVSALNIPLSARYVQTKQTVSPGSVMGRATFTLSYQ